ncbi:hypothetical protein MALU111345_20905 [Marinicrinis lubricantis]
MERFIYLTYYSYSVTPENQNDLGGFLSFWNVYILFPVLDERVTIKLSILRKLWHKFEYILHMMVINDL